MAITTIGLTGFEHGFIGAGAQNGGGLFDAAPGSGWSASTSSPRNGGYCAHLVAPANTVTRLQNNLSPVAGKLLTRFAVKVSTRPATGVATLAHGLNVSTLQYALQVSSTGVLSLALGSTGVAMNGATIDTTDWHLIEIRLDLEGGGGGSLWKVDGVLQPTPVPGGTFNSVSVFCLGTHLATQPTFTADYDDVIVGKWTDPATDWYGDGKVLAQLPGSMISNANINHFSPGDAGTVYADATNCYQMVDDPPGTGGWTATRSTTDNLAGRSATATSHLSMRPVPTAETAVANAVKALISYSSPATQANLWACQVGNTGGVVELWGLCNGVGKAYNVTANNFKSAIVPVATGGWTAATVNATYVRFGGCVSADISPVPTLQAWMLEVDWAIVGGVEPSVPNKLVAVA